MKVGIAAGPGRLQVADLCPLPPGPHDVVVDVEASGICHSDHDVLSGSLGYALPAVLGHELAGRVVEIGAEVTRVRVGQRVVGASKGACGHCWWCTRDLRHLCANAHALWATPRFVLDDGSAVPAFCGLGSFAERTVVHELSVVAVQTDLPAAQLALVGCGVVTGVGAVFNVAQVAPGDVVAVVGLGGVGMAMVQAAAVAGADRILVADPVEAKRTTALALGATDALVGTLDEIVAQAVEATDGRGVDTAFDAAGRTETLTAAYRMTRRAGTVVAIGASSATDTLDIGVWEHARSAKVLTSAVYGGANVDRDFPLIVRLAETGRQDLGVLVSQTVSLDVAAVSAAFAADGAIRSVIDPRMPPDVQEDPCPA